ncbi:MULTISPECIES: class I SAM-dependent methyltransferase [unclassified Actinopolyspora]|uniref:class I SAM-dependent methyltransferase n=1 Tax=Actinopolyspora TaxID=1849 RepID=UPI0013F5C298|nr:MULTISPECIES: class I SAM-dependent methyltransferase [unclassified Actinopolyspora]NHD17504.1 class I SAM-dependent methyltransferase [Actinopolyspora sp. BKK2]NHE76763.1 class I SAM-dependent methyltransferase [Actinopolyspora sp. BKK1]
MDTSIPRDNFERAYAEGSPPWVIGQSQPALVELERAGHVSGSVLDPGCGTGENTILLAELGYEVLGIDGSETAVATARRKAAERGVPARFEVADAMNPGTSPRFDTVVDSALLHVFGQRDRLAYTRGLHAVCRPGAVLHVLALADVQDAGGPRISAEALRDSFGPGWELEELRQDRYRGIAGEQYAEQLGVRPEDAVDTAAWLARARRR